jgi:hypothetical protein
MTDRKFADSPLEGTGFELAVPLWYKAVNGLEVGFRTQRIAQSWEEARTPGFPARVHPWKAVFERLGSNRWLRQVH